MSFSLPPCSARISRSIKYSLPPAFALHDHTLLPLAALGISSYHPTLFSCIALHLFQRHVVAIGTATIIPRASVYCCPPLPLFTSELLHQKPVEASCISSAESVQSCASLSKTTEAAVSSIDQIWRLQWSILPVMARLLSTSKV